MVTTPSPVVSFVDVFSCTTEHFQKYAYQTQIKNNDNVMLQFNEIELFITIIVITIIFIYYGRWDVWSVDSTEDRRKKNYIWVMCISTLVRC